MRTIEDRIKLSLKSAAVAVFGASGLPVFSKAVSESDTVAAVATNGAGVVACVALVACLPYGLHEALKKDAPSASLK